MLPWPLSSQGGACKQGLFQLLRLLRLLLWLLRHARSTEARHMQAHGVASAGCRPPTSAHPAVFKAVLTARNPSSSCTLAGARDHCRPPAATRTAAIQHALVHRAAATAPAAATTTRIYKGDAPVPTAGAVRAWINVGASATNSGIAVLSGEGWVESSGQRPWRVGAVGLWSGL